MALMFCQRHGVIKLTTLILSLKSSGRVLPKHGLFKNHLRNDRVILVP